MSPDRDIEVGDFRIAAVKTGRWKENSYIALHRPSGEAVVVDPGDEAERILGVLDALEATPKLILLTHAHYDHVGALDALCARYDLPFHLHAGDLPLLRRAALYALSFERRVVKVPNTHITLDQADLTWQGGTVGVIPTPGHTDGGVCYHWGGICFTGDTLMKRLVGRTDLPGSSGDGLAASVSHLLETLAPETLLFPGHGGHWSVADAREWWAANRTDPPEYAMEGMMR